MINKKYLKLLRSNKKFERDNFIYKLIGKRIIDSIDLIKIDAENILEIGINDNSILDYIKDRFDNSRIYRADLCPSKIDNNKFNFLEIDVDILNLKENSFDIIYSNFFFHITNSIGKKLKSVEQSLKPGGFFICAIPDIENIFQLLNSMYKTDILLYNGAYQRVNPTIEVNKILTILQKLNFDNPSIYLDTIAIEYTNFNKLLLDVKKMNMSYCYSDKKNTFENKKYFEKLDEVYKENFFDKSYNLDIKINIISAWKK